MLFVPLWQLLLPYVGKRWLPQHVGRSRHRARVWIETRDRSRSRHRYLDDCEPPQERFPFSHRGRTLGDGPYCIATRCRGDRVEFAYRDSGASEWLVGIRRRDHDHLFRDQRAQARVTEERARSRPPA